MSCATRHAATSARRPERPSASPWVLCGKSLRLLDTKEGLKGMEDIPRAANACLDSSQKHQGTSSDGNATRHNQDTAHGTGSAGDKPDPRILGQG